MATETDVVGVLRTHLRDIYTTLDNCAVYFEALDLTERVRSGSMSSKPNRTTQSVIRSRDRLAGYLEEEEEDDELPEQ